MPREYSREELWRLYEKLPEELQQAMFSVENADHIGEICKRNEIEEKTPEIAKQIGYVLLGLLPPEEFREWLEKEFGKEKARAISHDINRFILFPVKASLEKLYKEEVIPTSPVPKREIKIEKREDVYREPLG
jgi:hypothetical protein